MTKLIDIAKNGKIYGIPMDQLSYRQARHAIDFAVRVEPWLRENIGEFDVAWTVVEDLAHDSLRIMFMDQRDETYFRLAWMERDHAAEAIT